MEMMNRAIEDAADFRGMMEKIDGDLARRKNMLRLQDAAMSETPDRGESVQRYSVSLDRQPGENRVMHRARLKRERREAKVSKVSA